MSCILSKLKEVNELITKIDKNTSIINREEILSNLYAAREKLMKQEVYVSSVRDFINNEIATNSDISQLNNEIAELTSKLNETKLSKKEWEESNKDTIRLGVGSATNSSNAINRVVEGILDLENKVEQLTKNLKLEKDPTSKIGISENILNLTTTLDEKYAKLAELDEVYDISISNVETKNKFYNDKLKFLEAKTIAVAEKVKLVASYFIGGRLLKNKGPRLNKSSKDNTRSLNDHFTYKPVYSNLSKYMFPFSDDFEQLIDTTSISENDLVFVHKSKSLVNAIKSLIDSYMRDHYAQSNITELDIGETKKDDMYQSIHKLALLSNPTGDIVYKLPEEINTTIALGLITWLDRISSSLEHNRTNADIARFLGLADESMVELRHRQALAGVDTLLSTAAESVGVEVIKLLGLKAKDSDGYVSNDRLLKKLTVELGLIGIASLTHKATYEVDGKSKTLPAYVAIDKRNLHEIFIDDESLKTTDGAKEIFTVKLTDSFVKLADNKEVNFGRVARIANKLVKAEDEKTGPVFSPISVDKPIEKSNPYFEVTDEQVTSIRKGEATARTIVPEYVEAIDEMLSEEDSSERFYKLLGKENPEVFHTIFREGIEGKNNAIDSAVNDLMDLSNEMSTLGVTEMWFNYKVISTDRTYIVSNTVDPLGKKLHRFALSTGKGIVNNSKHADNVKLALGQAFGVDIDKHTKDESLKQSALIINELTKAYNNKDTVLEMLELSAKGFGKGSLKKVLKPHDVEHAILGVVEFIKLQEYLAENKGNIKGFETYLPIETDAVTSGIAIRNTQIPIGNNVVNTLAQTGIFLRDSKHKDFGTQAEDPEFRDAYNEPAHMMTKRLPNVDANVFKILDAVATENEIPKLSNSERKLNTKGYSRIKELTTDTSIYEAVEEIKRSFMKDPVMTSNYGAALKTVATALSIGTIENLYKLINAREVNTAINHLTDIAKIDGAPSSIMKDIEVLRNTEITDKALHKVLLSSETTQFIRNQTILVIGQVLTDVFYEEYGMMTAANKIINQSFGMMGKLFIAKLETAVEKIELELGKTPTVRQLAAIKGASANKGLTPEEIYAKAEALNAKLGRKGNISPEKEREVIMTMLDSMPAIDKPFTRDASQRLLVIDTDSRVKSDASYAINNRGKIVENAARSLTTGADTNTLSTAFTIKAFKEAVSAGAVNSVQQIDAAIQSVILSKYAVQGVHDANVWNINNVDEGTRDYSKAFIDINSSYSLVHSIMEASFRVFNNATEDEIRAVNRQYIQENPRKPQTVGKTLKNIARLRNDAETGRETVLSQEIVVEHAAHPGTEYIFNKDNVKYTRPVITEPIPKIEELSTFDPSNKSEITQFVHHSNIAQSRYNLDNTDIIISSNKDETIKLHNSNKGIQTERVYNDAFKGTLPLTKTHHFGNPFITNGVTSKMQDWQIEAAKKEGYIINAGSDILVSLRYGNWLNGLADENVQPVRRKWILDQINAGNLDGKELIYYKDSKDTLNHARVLRDVVKQLNIVNNINSSVDEVLVHNNNNSAINVKDTTNNVEPVNVDSNQQGLEYALTNPTHTSPRGYSWTKGDKPTRDMLAKGIDYKGKHYADVEQAFQALKDKNESKTKPTKDNSNNYTLMVDLITTKLQAYPRLVKGINDKGGLEYLSSIVHQPTNANSIWETGGQDWFKSALIDSYNNVSDSKPLSLEDTSEEGINTSVIEYQRTSKMPTITGNFEVFKDISDNLRKLFPGIKMAVADDLVDEYGEKVLGRAINGAVEFSLNGNLDTMPHEYAHVYINMLESTPTVKNAIAYVMERDSVTSEMAKEILATYLGEKFVESTDSFIAKFRSAIAGILKNIFSPKIDPRLTTLSNAFINGYSSEEVTANIKAQRNNRQKAEAFKATDMANRPNNISLLTEHYLKDESIQEIGTIEQYYDYLSSKYNNIFIHHGPIFDKYNAKKTETSRKDLGHYLNFTDKEKSDVWRWYREDYIDTLHEKLEYAEESEKAGIKKEIEAEKAKKISKLLFAMQIETPYVTDSIMKDRGDKGVSTGNYDTIDYTNMKSIDSYIKEGYDAIIEEDRQGYIHQGAILSDNYIRLGSDEDIKEFKKYVNNDILDETTQTMYHGTAIDISKFINNNGDLVLKPSKNFQGKTSSVSFTGSKDTAMRYAAQIKGGGPLGFAFENANVFKINPGVIQGLVRENEEEFALNTAEDIIIPKGSFEIIPHKLSKEVTSLTREYSMKEYLADNYTSNEIENMSETDKISSYIDGYISEENSKLAASMLAEMEYLHKGEYYDSSTAISSPSLITLKEGSNSLLVPTRAPNGLESKAVKALKGFDIKDEFHLTVFGFPQGKEITEWLKVNGTKRMEKLQSLIDEADFSYIESPEIDRISRDREEFIDWNNKELGKHIIHEEAIIQLVKAPGVKKFIDKVNAELGFNFPVPFPHISLAVKGTKFGIGIADEAAYKALKPVSINEDELTTNELTNRIASLKDELKSATAASEIKILNEMLIEAETDVYNNIKPTTLVKLKVGDKNYHATNEDWDGNIRVDNELGFHIGDISTAINYANETFSGTTYNLKEVTNTTDLKPLQIKDYTMTEEGGWDIDLIYNDLKSKLDIKNKSFEGIQQAALKAGYNAFIYVNETEGKSTGLNSLIIIDPTTVEVSNTTVEMMGNSVNEMTSILDSDILPKQIEVEGVLGGLINKILKETTEKIQECKGK